MARTLTVTDAYVIMNALVKEATGQESTLQTENLSGYISAGETVLAQGKENTPNALSIVLARTIVAIRPYKAQFNLVQTEHAGTYSNRVRKISFMGKEAQATGWYNTDINPRNLYNGRDNTGSSTSGATAVGTMWEQNKAVPYEVNFGGSYAWDKSITVYEDQIDMAFRDPSEMARFANGIMERFRNDIEVVKEAENRLAVLNYIGGAYDLAASANGSVVNLTAAYNAKFGTNLTTAQLQTTYLKDFLAFFVSYLKVLMKNMRYESADYHVNPSVTQDGSTYTYLPRHTSIDNLRCMLYSPLFTDAEALVMPEIFNTQYLNIDTQYEDVLFWQNKENPSKVKITPAIPNFSTGVQGAGDTVTLDYVVGLIYDKDAIMTQYCLDRSITTPLEARKGYRNIWNHYRRNSINDFTENHVLLYMADPANNSSESGSSESGS